MTTTKLNTKDTLVFARNRWEIAHQAQNQATGISQWERRDGSYICNVGDEAAVQPLPAKPAKA